MMMMGGEMMCLPMCLLRMVVEGVLVVMMWKHCASLKKIARECHQQICRDHLLRLDEQFRGRGTEQRVRISILEQEKETE